MASLSGADLSRANVSGADFGLVYRDGRNLLGPARGLTQAQMDMAYADPANPPKLQGVVDAETGEPVVWRGKPLHSDA